MLGVNRMSENTDMENITHDYCEDCEITLCHPDDYETKCYHCGNQCDICNECHYCIRGINPCKNKMPIDIEREQGTD